MVVIFGVVISGCGKTTGESANPSSQSPKQKTKITETTSPSSKQNTKPAVKGKKHALLLKRNGSNFDGRTVEGEDYVKYLADGTVPSGQIIEFIYQKKQEKAVSLNASLDAE